MVSVIVFILALIPVLVIGAVLIDLLFAAAPRRGKWPYPDTRYASSRLRRLENRRRVAMASLSRRLRKG